MSPRCLFWPIWGTVNNKSLLLSECPITPLWLTMALEKARWLYWQCSDLSRIDTIPLSAALPTVRHRLDFFFPTMLALPSSDGVKMKDGGKETECAFVVGGEFRRWWASRHLHTHCVARWLDIALLSRGRPAFDLKPYFLLSLLVRPLSVFLMSCLTLSLPPRPPHTLSPSLSSQIRPVKLQAAGLVNWNGRVSRPGQWALCFLPKHLQAPRQPHACCRVQTHTHTRKLNRPHSHAPPANILHFTHAKQLRTGEQVGVQYLTQGEWRKTALTVI